MSVPPCPVSTFAFRQTPRTGNAVPAVLSRSPQPGGGIVKGLVEEITRQEKLAKALKEAQLSEFPLFAAA